MGTRLLVAFTRNIISSVNSDLIALSLGSAARELGVPKEEAEKVLTTLLRFKRKHDVWPAGFMP